MPSYLVTSNARVEGGVYLLDTERGRLKKILHGSYRGATRGPDGCFYVVSGVRNPKRDTSIIHRLQPESWRSEPVAEYPVKDSHDLRWIEGHFYLAASVGNHILKLDAQGRLVDRMQIVEDERDICHVNCLGEAGGELYCTVFTLAPGERREKNRTGVWHTDGKLLKLDFPAGRFTVAAEGLCQPHSLAWLRGQLYLVESHTSSVTRLDLTSGTRERVTQYHGFLRGLAFGEGEIVLGVCVMYRKDRLRLRPLPAFRQLQERLFPFAGVVVLDEQWRVRRRVPLPGAEVYDILPLRPEEARALSRVPPILD